MNPLLIGPLFDGIKFVFGGIVDSIKQKRDIAAQEVKQNQALSAALATAKIRRIQTQQDAEISWEQTALQNAGIKDDVMMFVIVTPMVLCFIPGMAPYIRDGFTAIDQTVPAWWQAAFGATVAVSYGLKKFSKLFPLKTKKGGK